jgi:hypothetical protein
MPVATGVVGYLLVMAAFALLNMFSKSLGSASGDSNDHFVACRRYSGQLVAVLIKNVRDLDLRPHSRPPREAKISSMGLFALTLLMSAIYV